MAPHEIPVKRLRWPGFRDLASISFVKLRSDCKIKKRRPILGSWKYEHSISVTRTNFFQVCVRLPWKKASSAPLGTENGKGNHNFSNVVRALHLTLKWREDYLSFIIYFNQPSATPAELKTVFTSKRNVDGQLSFPHAAMWYSLFSAWNNPHMQISQDSQIVVSHIYTSTFNRPSTNRPFWSTVYIQWLFSAVCLALNSGEETAASNRCYLLYCFKLCLSNHAFIKKHILPGGLTGLKFIMKVWGAGDQVIILSKRSSLQLRSCLLLMNASLFNQPSSSKNLPFLIDTYKGAIVFLSSLPFRDPCSLKLY